MEHQTSDLLTARELASCLRVSADTVRTWARRGRIPTIRLSRKVVRYDLADVLAALKEPARKVVSA